MKCRCGCDTPGQFLITGIDFGGEAYTNEPACAQAADYCEENAAILNLPFHRSKMPSPPDLGDGK